ncbi:MAG: lytic murein transglycosylase [Acidimicrobiales bacterium]
MLTSPTTVAGALAVAPTTTTTPAVVPPAGPPSSLPRPDPPRRAVPLLQPGGATGGFSRVLGLLEAEAAGPGPLEAEIVRAEDEVTRLQAELGTASEALRAAEAEQEQAREELARTEAAIRRLDELIAALRPPPPARTPSGPTGPPTLTSLAARPVPSDPTAVARGERSRLVRWLPSRVERLFTAQQQTATSRDGWSVKLAEYTVAANRLEEVRQEVWSKLADPTFRSAARVLIAGPDGQQVPPSRLAVSDAPAAALDRYRGAAASCPGLSWTVLAAIGSIESDHGRSPLPGVHSGANVAGAMGPMQFLAGTWAVYGADGDGDGRRDVYNPSDAVLGAATYLCTNGAGGLTHLADAIWAYNHAGWYVDDVLALALRYGSDGLASDTGAPPGASPDVAALVENPNLELTPWARADLLAGVVDQRLVQVLAAASARHRLTVSVIRTGHSVFVKGTDRVSNHFYGRGIDISAVDGQPVSHTNNAALEVALAVLTTALDFRPDEFGSPWPDLGAFPGTFADADHTDHLHLGWRS